MQAGVLLGVLIGVLLNLVLPELVIVVTLAVVLSFNAFKTLKSGVKKWEAETHAKSTSELPSAQAMKNKVCISTEASCRQEGDIPVPITTGGLPKEITKGALLDLENASNQTRVRTKCESSAPSAELVRLQLEDRVQHPLWAWVPLIIMCTFLLTHSLILRGERSSSVRANKVWWYGSPTPISSVAGGAIPGLEPCDAFYWLLSALPIPFYGSFLVYFARRNHAKFLQKQSAGFRFSKGDILWTTRNTLMLPPIAVCSGIMSGMLGIGGGMILGPMFIALEIEPQVSTAVTGFMLLFTGFAGTVEYLTVGKLPWRFFLWFGSIGVIGGQIGQRFVKRLVNSTGRPSIVVLLLGGVIATAVLCMTAVGISDLVSASEDGDAIWQFNFGVFSCDETEMLKDSGSGSSLEVVDASSLAHSVK